MREFPLAAAELVVGSSRLTLRAPPQPLPAPLFPAMQERIRSALRGPTLITGGTGSGKTAYSPRILWWELSHTSRAPVLVVMPRKTAITEALRWLRAAIDFPPHVLFEVVGERSLFSELRTYGTSNADLSLLIYVTPALAVPVAQWLLEAGHAPPHVMFDEVHEHGPAMDLAISWCAHTGLGITLITATPDEDLDRIRDFFPNIRRVDIGNNTAAHVVTTVQADDIVQALRRYPPAAGATGIYIVKSIRTTRGEAARLRRLFPHIDFQPVSSADALGEQLTLPDRPVVLVATPVVESSLTIPRATVVYDTGDFIQPVFFTVDKRCKIDVSRMLQRRGRVGRTADGLYVQMYSSLGPRVVPVDSEFVYNFVYFQQLYGIQRFFFGPAADRLRFATDFFLRHVAATGPRLADQVRAHKSPANPLLLNYPAPERDLDRYVLARKMGLFSYRGTMSMRLDLDPRCLRGPVADQFNYVYILSGDDTDVVYSRGPL